MADHIPSKSAKPRVGALDWGMAAFLAAAVGFVLLVMPNGLPGEPLGARRFVIAGLASALTLFVIGTLLRTLSKPRHPRVSAAPKPVDEASEAPRLRRADAHPDAPSRSPILAARELGLPLDEVAIAEQRPAADLADVENVDFDAEWERPLPGFIDEEARPDEAEPVAWEPVNEADQGDTEPAATADLPLRAPEVDPAAVRQDDEPAQEPPLAVPFPSSRVRAPAPRPSGTATLDEVSAALPVKDTVGVPIATLLARFESGLVQRPQPSARGGADKDAALDERLRSALGDLKRMSGRR